MSIEIRSKPWDIFDNNLLRNQNNGKTECQRSRIVPALKFGTAPAEGSLRTYIEICSVDAGIHYITEPRGLYLWQSSYLEVVIEQNFVLRTADVSKYSEYSTSEIFILDQN